MNIKNNIINYLYDRDVVVAMYDDCLYIFNYIRLEHFGSDKMIVLLKDRSITIKGQDLSIVRITKEELLIRGKISGIDVKLHEQNKN